MAPLLALSLVDSRSLGAPSLSTIGGPLSPPPILLHLGGARLCHRSTYHHCCCWLESMRPAQLELVAETRTWSPWICRSRVSKGGTTAETERRQYQGLLFSSPASPAEALKDAAAGCALHLGSHRQLVSSFPPALPNASEAYALFVLLAIAVAALQLAID